MEYSTSTPNGCLTNDAACKVEFQLPTSVILTVDVFNFFSRMEKYTSAARSTQKEFDQSPALKAACETSIARATGCVCPRKGYRSVTPQLMAGSSGLRRSALFCARKLYKPAMRGQNQACVMMLVRCLKRPVACDSVVVFTSQIYSSPRSSCVFRGCKTNSNSFLFSFSFSNTARGKNSRREIVVGTGTRRERDGNANGTKGERETV